MGGRRRTTQTLSSSPAWPSPARRSRYSRCQTAQSRRFWCWTTWWPQSSWRWPWGSAGPPFALGSRSWRKQTQAKRKRTQTWWGIWFWFRFFQPELDPRHHWAEDQYSYSGSWRTCAHKNKHVTRKKSTSRITVSTASPVSSGCEEPRQRPKQATCSTLGSLTFRCRWRGKPPTWVSSRRPEPDSSSPSCPAAPHTCRSPSPGCCSGWRTWRADQNRRSARLRDKEKVNL